MERFFVTLGCAVVLALTGCASKEASLEEEIELAGREEAVPVATAYSEEAVEAERLDGFSTGMEQPPVVSETPRWTAPKRAKKTVRKAKSRKAKKVAKRRNKRRKGIARK